MYCTHTSVNKKIMFLSLKNYNDPCGFNFTLAPLLSYPKTIFLTRFHNKSQEIRLQRNHLSTYFQCFHVSKQVIFAHIIFAYIYGLRIFAFNLLLTVKKCLSHISHQNQEKIKINNILPKEN